MLDVYGAEPGGSRNGRMRAESTGVSARFNGNAAVRFLGILSGINWRVRTHPRYNGRGIVWPAVLWLAHRRGGVRMRIHFDRFPGGVTKALTLSFDDGREYDRRLVKLFNDYGLRSTFHLNSGFLGQAGYLDASEVRELFQGHEVSAHTVEHPFLDQSPAEQIAAQVIEDRKALEALCGYPVKGMSYPFGTYSDRVADVLRAVGMDYSRTVNSHGTYRMPDDWLRWHPTCHHKQMVEHAEKFVALEQRFPRMALLYVWGHSYEFENDRNWDLVERFGEIAAGRSDIWYATNAEIYAYCKALDQLRFTVDCRIVHNPSAESVWISVEGDPVEIPAGRTVQLHAGR